MCALKVKRVAMSSMGAEKRTIGKLKCLAHKILHQFMTSKFEESNIEIEQDFKEIAQNEANERLQQEADHNIYDYKQNPLTPLQFDNMRVLCMETAAGCFYWDLKKQLVDEDLHTCGVLIKKN